MNIQHQMSIWHDATAFHAQPVGQKRRRRSPGAAKYIWFGIFATVVSIINPMLLALTGIGMSYRDIDVVFVGALASLLAIIAGFLVIRRLLSVPLLQSYGYVALTFVSSFALVAVGLKFLRIEFSSPQVFLALAALRAIPVYHVKQFNESLTGRVVLDHLRENTLGAVVPSLIYPQFKRAIDLMMALLCLPLVASIIGVCAILIKLETPGPVFYCQRRAGFGGRPFTIFKLRTMTNNHNGKDYTLEGDERITRVGRILRQYRLDELPQIINILR